MVGQLPAGIQAGGLPEGSRPQQAGPLTLDLAVQPVIEDLPVQLRRTQRLAGACGLIEPVIGQAGDEGEHPRVAGQPQQIPDALDVVETLPGTPCVAAVEAGEEVQDLGVGEVFQRQHPRRVPAGTPSLQRLVDLAVVPEVLGAAGQHDLRLAGGGFQQGRQVGVRRGVGDLLHQLVVPVQQDRDPPVLDHVTDLGVGDVPDVQPVQVLAEQVEQIRALLQGAQLDQQRLDRAHCLRQPPDQLQHQEGLAPPEIPQHGREPGTRLPQPGDQPVQCSGLDRGRTVLITMQHRTLLAEPLWHVQLWLVQLPHVIGGFAEQLILLPGAQPGEVDQPPVLRHAVQLHPLPPGGSAHLLTGFGTGVHQVRAQIGVHGLPRSVHLRDEPAQHRLVHRPVHRPDRPHLHRTVGVGAGHDQVGRTRNRGGEQLDACGFVPEPGHGGHLVQETVAHGCGVGEIPPARREGFGTPGDGTRDSAEGISLLGPGDGRHPRAVLWRGQCGGCDQGHGSVGVPPVAGRGGPVGSDRRPAVRVARTRVAGQPVPAESEVLVATGHLRPSA